MYNFSRTPPPDPRGNSLQIRRTPAGQFFKGIITTDDVIGTATHFYKGRTTPCANEDCDACSNGVPWRWHFYAGLYCPNTKSHCLFEMTAKAVEPLKTYRMAHGTLRGCQMTARRVNSSPNARVMITTGVADLEKTPIPKSPHLLEALSILWNIPLNEIHLDGLVKDAPALSIDSRKNQIQEIIDGPAGASSGGNGSK